MRETDPLLASPTNEVTRTSINEQQQQQQSQSQSPPLQPQQLPWRQRAKVLFVEYGSLGLVVHIVLSLVVLALVYIGVSNGVDVAGLLAYLGFADSAKGSTAHAAGAFVISYALYKLLAPVRVPLTFAVTPLVLRALRRRGYMLPPGHDSSNAPAAADDDDLESRSPSRQTSSVSGSPAGIELV